jgi:translation initiation factor 2-alpha kinase 4
MAAREEDRLLKEQIKLDDSLNKERRLKLARQELERKRQQSLEQLDDGELASREIILDEAIRIEGFEGNWTTWNLVGGKKAMLWTTYIAEPVEKDGTIDPNFVRTTLPTLWAQVIDFSKPFYSTDQGKKKVDSLVTEVKRLQITKSNHVLRVYGVKRDRTPKGQERVIVFVERAVDGGFLKSRLPNSGFDCLTAIVSL